MDTPLANGRPFRFRDAESLGFSRHRLHRALCTGDLRRALRGVYVDASVPDDHDLRLRCLSLVCPQYAVVFGRTAAWLYGVDAFSPAERHVLTPECAVPHRRGRPRHADIRVVERQINSADVATGPVKVTTPLRTALDLARDLHRPMALAALDAFAHAGLVTGAQLRAAVEEHRHRPGVRQARALIPYVEPLTESPGESWLRLRLLDAGFPRPVAQVSLGSKGREVYRIDLGYPAYRLGIEYDGREHHSSADQRRRDARRRDAVESRWGWQLLSCDLGDVMGRHPAVELAVGDVLSLSPLLPRRW